MLTGSSNAKTFTSPHLHFLLCFAAVRLCLTQRRPSMKRTAAWPRSWLGKIVWHSVPFTSQQQHSNLLWQIKKECVCRWGFNVLRQKCWGEALARLRADSADRTCCASLKCPMQNRTSSVNTVLGATLSALPETGQLLSFPSAVNSSSACPLPWRCYGEAITNISQMR